MRTVKEKEGARLVSQTHKGVKYNKRPILLKNSTHAKEQIQAEEQWELVTPQYDYLSHYQQYYYVYPGAQRSSYCKVAVATAI